MSDSNFRRVPLLDELRGLVILLMVFYRAAYDLVYIFGVNWPFFSSPLMHWLQLFIATSFITVSGICCRFSRNNLKRGLLTFGLGMVLTVVTSLFIPEQIVRFGVLHLLGASMVLFALLEPLLDRIPTPLGAPVFGFLLFATLYVPYRAIGIPPLLFRLPDALYESGWLFPFGFPAAGFYSSDYFPLVPWLFLFLAGSFLGVYAREGRMPAIAYESHLPLLARVGRHTIWIYMLHQPITYGLLWFLFHILRQP